MSDPSIQVLQDMKRSLVDFFDELIDMFPSSNKDLLQIRLTIKDRVPFIEIMNYFVANVLPEKELIKSRSDEFFTDRNTMFKILGESNSTIFKRIWNQLDNDDKKAIWKWIDGFVAYTEKYKKLNQ